MRRRRRGAGCSKPHSDAPRQPRSPPRGAQAFTEHGFAYIKNHGVCPELLRRVRECGREFFARDTTAKEAAAIGMPGGDGAGQLGRGYQRRGLNVTKGMRDDHEALDFYRELRADHPAAQQLLGTPHAALALGRNPRLGEPFDSTVREYGAAFLPLAASWVAGRPPPGAASSMGQLGEAMARVMAAALSAAGSPAGDELPALVNDSFWGFRVIGYPQLDGVAADGSMGISCGEQSAGRRCGRAPARAAAYAPPMARSTDYGFLTFVNQDCVPGALQVQSVQGEWLDADDIEGCLVVNIGDMAARISAGRWKSTPHRVINHGNTFRVSAPFFFEARCAGVLAGGCVGRGSPCRGPQPGYTAHINGLMYGASSQRSRTCRGLTLCPQVSTSWARCPATSATRPQARPSLARSSASIQKYIITQRPTSTSARKCAGFSRGWRTRRPTPRST